MNSIDFSPPIETPFLTKQLLTYIGNKRKLLSFIEQALTPILEKIGRKLVTLDGFAGSGVVSRFLKGYSSELYSNDLEYYAFVIGKCHLTNKADVPPDLSQAIADLNARKLRSDLDRGIIEEMYAPQNDDDIRPGERVFYTNHNARIIDNIRRTIDEYPEGMYPYLVSPLLQKASVHANTSGVFKGFYKNSVTKIGQFGGDGRDALSRITRDIALEEPIFGDYDCRCIMSNQDINQLVHTLPEVDVAYFDPPYNQHPYGSNYFMLNVIATYQRPAAVSKVSGIPEQWNKSDYNKRAEVSIALSSLIRDTKAKFILLSYNNEGFLTAEETRDILEQHGRVSLLEQQYATFRGSRNLAGRSKDVIELMFVVEKK